MFERPPLGPRQYLPLSDISSRDSSSFRDISSWTFGDNIIAGSINLFSFKRIAGAEQCLLDPGMFQLCGLP